MTDQPKEIRPFAVTCHFCGVAGTWTSTPSGLDVPDGWGLWADAAVCERCEHNQFFWWEPEVWPTAIEVPWRHEGERRRAAYDWAVLAWREAAAGGLPMVRERGAVETRDVVMNRWRRSAPVDQAARAHLGWAHEQGRELDRLADERDRAWQVADNRRAIAAERIADLERELEVVVLQRSEAHQRREQAERERDEVRAELARLKGQP